MPFDDPTAPASVENLAARLRKACHGRSTIEIAQFQFIGLETVESAYGTRWPDEKARIFDTAGTFLGRRLSRSDVLVRGTGGFLVVFGLVSGREAEVASLNLSHALNDFFLGVAGEGPPPEIGVEIQSVSVANLADALGDAAFVETKSSTNSAERRRLSELEWRFQPVWDVRREALASYYVVPYRRRPPGRLPGYQFEGGWERSSNFTEVDEASLRVSEQAIRALFGQGRQALVGVSVHITSLANAASRSRLLSVMEGFDQNLLRYKTLKIAGVAPGFPRLYLNEIIQSLRSRVPNVIIGAAWNEPDLGSLIGAGPIAVGFALPRSVIGPNPVVDQVTLLSRIKSAAEIAHATKRPFFVEGGIGRELALRLRSIGVNNISSSLIWPSCEAPEGMTKWTVDRLKTTQTEPADARQA